MHNKKTPALVSINTALTEHTFPNSPSGSQHSHQALWAGGCHLGLRAGLGWRGWGRRGGIRQRWDACEMLGKGSEPRAGKLGKDFDSQDIIWKADQSPTPSKFGLPCNSPAERPWTGLLPPHSRRLDLVVTPLLLCLHLPGCSSFPGQRRGTQSTGGWWWRWQWTAGWNSNFKKLSECRPRGWDEPHPSLPQLNLPMNLSSSSGYGVMLGDGRMSWPP